MRYQNLLKIMIFLSICILSSTLQFRSTLLSDSLVFIVQNFTIRSTYKSIQLSTWLGLGKMRIFVSSVDQTGTRRNTRILLHNCTSTTQLTRQICKQLNIPRSIAVIKLKSDFINLVIIDNWPLEHYPIKSGTTFTIEIIQSALKENSELAEPLYKIEEQMFNEQQVESQSSPSNSTKSNKQIQPENNKIQLKYSHYLEQSLNRMLETVRNGCLQDISGLMKEQPPVADQVQLEQLMKKKYEYLLNQIGDCGRNALHWAIHINHIDIVSFLLIKGASLTKVTIDQYSPLQLAVQHHSSEIVSLLMQQPNFNVNQVTKHGTALHLAVRNQDLKCIEMLLQNDASLDIPDSQNRLPIDICQNQKIKAILARKADMGKLPTPTITKGAIYRVGSRTYRLKQRSLLLNPFKNEVSITTLNGQVEQKLTIDVIQEVQEITQKSWLMKSTLFYFKIIMKDEEKDIMFATKQSVTHKRWLKNFRIAIRYQQFIMYIKPIAAADQVIEFLDDQKGQVVLHKRKVQDKGAKKTQSIMNLKSQEQSEALSPLSKAKKLKKTAEQSDSRSNEDQKLKQSQIILGSVLQVKRLNFQSTPSSNSQIEHQNSHSKSQGQSGNRFRKNSDNRVEIVSQFQPNPMPSISYVDFQMIKLLGNGAFGKVYLAKYKKTGKSYALKVLNKKKLFSKKQLKYAVGEANILKKLDSQFIVKLYFAFQTPTNLYMALDHCSFGDLSELIITKEKLKESTARFIIAQLVLAIQYLHSLKILYRDLKPQNILIAGDGYIRLTDFGLSRQNSFASSFCGSPAYLSPQMLEKKGVGLSSDIYGIGCVLYEMVVGQPPFYDQNMESLFQNIRSGKLRFPSHLSIQIKSLISRLLERDLTKRLGVKNINQIKNHDFFKKLDWQLLKNKKIAPPNQIFINYEQQGQSADIDLQVSGQKLTVIDQDYNETTKMINRVKNFTFVREQGQHKNITSLKCIKNTN